jgi:hypothetical protein
MTNAKILEEENHFLKERIKLLENKVNILSEKLDVSRLSRVKLLDEAQQINDKNLAILQRHSAVIAILNQKTYEFSSLVEENITLKNKSMKDDKEVQEIKNAYRLAMQKIDEENKILLNMNDRLNDSYNEIERLKTLYQATSKELYNITHQSLH